MVSLALPLLACAAGAIAGGAFAISPTLRRFPSVSVGWLLAPAPLTAFVLLLLAAPNVLTGQKLHWSLTWMPSLGAEFALALDGLSLLFGLIITGIGTLITIYAGYYFAPHEPTERGEAEGRFFLYLLLFMTAMLGTVLAADVITLFVFWEMTSITSFMLIAYKTSYAASREGAFKALFVTGAGGIALLAGLLLASALSDSTDLSKIVHNGDALRASEWYHVMLLLIAFGAFTKSAQFPFHFWLPAAMSAPTPASAFLHSATMVKAGVYLLARLYPAFGSTATWFWMLSLIGMSTMLLGAVIGLRQTDLKALLAYSTISQLGALTMLTGQNTPIAFKALVIGILAHALYKGALFMIAGGVDHATGTRDLRQLGKLWRAMPLTFAVAAVAALSMAGLPPLLGFLAKESLLTSLLEPTDATITQLVQPAASILAGALMLTQAAIVSIDTFVTPPGAGFPSCFNRPSTRENHSQHKHHVHDLPLGMLLSPITLGALSLVITTLQPEVVATLLAQAASTTYGNKVKVSLELFHEINLPLVLSGVAIGVGAGLFAWRNQARAVLHHLTLSMDTLYNAVLDALDVAAQRVTRLQNGRVRRYLFVMLVAMLVLVVAFGELPRLLSNHVLTESLATALQGQITPTEVLRASALTLAVAASLVSVIIRRDLLAILAFASSGLAVAVLIALEPSPDVALVQAIVDILSMVILVLALSRIPQHQRRQAEALNKHPSISTRYSALLAMGVSLVVFLLSWYALASRPRISVVTPFYERNAKPLTGSADIVGAIVVDFRGFDTLIEICVFGTAGVGVMTLLRLAMKKAEASRLIGSDESENNDLEERSRLTLSQKLSGIDGLRTSPFVRMVARAAMPLSIMLAFVQMVYGHDQPGDGFTAGVTVSLAVGLWYVVFGYERTKQQLAAFKPPLLIGVGVLVVLLSSTSPILFGQPFFSPYNFGEALHLPLPHGFDLTTSLLFELAICLVVLGSAVFILDTLGRPSHMEE